MIKVNNGIDTQVVKNERDGREIMDRFLRVADVKTVFSEPFERDGVTIIQAAEITASGGYGYGEGSATGPADPNANEEKTTSSDVPSGEGQGGGGGGLFTGRPVAAIIIDKNGARVEPIVDATKVALAFFTMLGSVAFMLVSMRSAAKKQIG